MGSLGSSHGVGNKAMWLYPKFMGFNPSERWGHSACYSNGLVYIFGGCCGGLHFSDVLILNLDTMSWTTLIATGASPGPRDSHSSVLWSDKFVIFGGTNGTKKVNYLHMLDLGSNEWIRPICKGKPPSPRESHTVTLVGDSKLVVFGGSGEGVGNYLNDLYILDLGTMRWSCPEIKGYVPEPRDSHVAVAVGNKVFVHGGDSGDRYHGEVDVFDTDTMTWTRLSTRGCPPGARAGHAAVSIGSKVYITGGVGDKKYYNDAWVLDTSVFSWVKLDILCGQSPQGRFSHTAIAAGSDIVIYGGCGEDERPLKELLILHLGSEHPDGRYNVPLCKSPGNHWDQEKKRLNRREENSVNTMLLGRKIEPEGWKAREQVLQSSCVLPFSSDTLHPKRRRTVHSGPFEIESEPEDLSVSMSQQSSSSQSDKEQTMVLKKSVSPTASISPASPASAFPLLAQSSRSPRHTKSSNNNNPVSMMMNNSPPNFPDVCPLLEPEMLSQRPRQCLAETGVQSMIGAGVQGKVDGEFDSGYLMTATVNGRLFRGVLFAPVPAAAAAPSGTTVNQNLGSAGSEKLPHCNTGRGPTTCCSNRPKPQPPLIGINNNNTNNNTLLESGNCFGQAKTIRPVGVPTGVIVRSVDRESGNRGNDLQGLVLTLGAPGCGSG